MRYEIWLFGWEQRNLNQRGERTFSVECTRLTRSGQIPSERTRTRRKGPHRLNLSVVTRPCFVLGHDHRPRDTLIGVRRKP